MIGHVGGAPVEELVLPLLASGTMVLLAAKAYITRATHWRKAPPQRRSQDEDLPPVDREQHAVDVPGER